MGKSLQGLITHMGRLTQGLLIPRVSLWTDRRQQVTGQDSTDGGHSQSHPMETRLPIQKCHTVQHPPAPRSSFCPRILKTRSSKRLPPSLRQFF